MKVLNLLILCLALNSFGQIEFKSTHHYELEQASFREPPGYDPDAKFMYIRSNEYMSYEADEELEYLTIGEVDTNFIDLSKYPNLISVHILNSRLDSLIFPEKNDLTGIWIDELELKSKEIDLQNCIGLLHFKVDICDQTQIKNLEKCENLTLIVLAGMYTTQRFEEILMKLDYLERILLVEFKYSNEEAKKIEEQLKNRFPNAIVYVIL